MAKKKKRVPLGKPLPRISETYEEPAPSEIDLDALTSLWDQFAPARFRGLLDAENKNVLEQTAQRPSGRFVWDDQAKKYKDLLTGQMLTREDLHQALSAFAKSYTGRL